MSVSERQPTRGRPTSVVLLDDEKATSEAAGALSRAGYQVLREPTLERALADVRNRASGILLLELTARDGRMAAAVDQLRAAGPDVPIIVLSEHDDEESAVAALEHGAQDYLVGSKIDERGLERAIRHAAARQRVLRDLRVRVQEVEAQDARLSAILQTTADALIIVDESGIVRFANAAAEKLFDRSAEQLIGAPFGYPVTAGGTAEVDLVLPAGHIVAELRASEIVWEGSPAAIASLRDITGRREAEERERKLIREQLARAQAEAAERRARFLVDAGTTLAETLDYSVTLSNLAALAVPFLADWCIVDVIEPDGRVRRMAVATADTQHAEHARELKGFDPDPKALAGVTRALHTRQAELVTDLTPEYMEQLSTRPEYRDLLRRIGLRSVMYLPLIARGRPVGVLILATSRSGRRYDASDLAFAEDIARRVAIALDNARLYQDAQLANKAKSDFLAVMSHELRTPLNAVIGYADLLLMGLPVEVPVPARAHIERIRTSARHLLHLIEEILTYARMEAGREQLDIDQLQVEELLQDVSALIEPLAFDKGLALRILRPEESCTMRTDPGKLRQILLNLLSNAVKFTDSGEVGLQFSCTGETTEFIVWDTGRGINQDHIPHIFDPFWQAEQSRTRRAEGTGLGLAVAQRLAHLLGGDLHVESTLGAGTRFSLVIPTTLSYGDAEVAHAQNGVSDAAV